MRKNPADAHLDGKQKNGATRGVSGRQMRRRMERAERLGRDTFGRDEMFKNGWEAPEATKNRGSK